MKIENLQIKIPALKRPTLSELQKEWSSIKRIERDISPMKETVFTLGSVFQQDGETYISGQEYEIRLPKNLLGFQQAKWLVENQGKFPEFKDATGIYIDFSGLVVVDEFGNRRVPCLDRGGERWYLRWVWLGRDFNSYGRIASSGKWQSDARKLGSSKL